MRWSAGVPMSSLGFREVSIGTPEQLSRLPEGGGITAAGLPWYSASGTGPGTWALNSCVALL